MLLTLNPPQAHIDKFPNLSYVNLVSEPRSYQNFFAEIFSTNQPDKNFHSTWGHQCGNKFKVGRFFFFFFQNVVETNKNLQQLNEIVCSIETKLEDLSTMQETLDKLTVAILGAITQYVNPASQLVNSHFQDRLNPKIHHKSNSKPKFPISSSTKSHT